jgi:hypothetical protein
MPSPVSFSRPSLVFGALLLLAGCVKPETGVTPDVLQRRLRDIESFENEQYVHRQQYTDQLPQDLHLSSGISAFVVLGQSHDYVAVARELTGESVCRYRGGQGAVGGIVCLGDESLSIEH